MRNTLLIRHFSQPRAARSRSAKIPGATDCSDTAPATGKPLPAPLPVASIIILCGSGPTHTQSITLCREHRHAQEHGKKVSRPPNMARYLLEMDTTIWPEQRACNGQPGGTFPLASSSTRAGETETCFGNVAFGSRGFGGTREETPCYRQQRRWQPSVSSRPPRLLSSNGT